MKSNKKRKALRVGDKVRWNGYSISTAAADNPYKGIEGTIVQRIGTQASGYDTIIECNASACAEAAAKANTDSKIWSKASRWLAQYKADGMFAISGNKDSILMEVCEDEELELVERSPAAKQSSAACERIF